MTGRSNKLLARDARMTEFADQGMSPAEIAAALNVRVTTVYLWARSSGLQLKRSKRAGGIGSRHPERDTKMVAMFRQGVTLAKIGAQFGLSRERVRQILKRIGVCAEEGGIARNAASRRESACAKREAYWLGKYGLPFAVVKQLQQDGVTKGFQDHKRNSAARGIPFHLTFIDWLSVWQASGKLDQRGRGKGKYVMSRIRDDGAYELGNVHVQLATENSREAVEKWRGTTKEHTGVYLLAPGNKRPWMAGVGRVSLGRFETQQQAVEARAAYLAANPNRSRSSAKGYAHIRAQAGRAERFQVMVGKKYVGSFKTAEEALTARAAYLGTLSAADPNSQVDTGAAPVHYATPP
ncbi:sigma factor-like helix-turn-helix DNA-binding protein [Comamonas sp.]|uniref:sigma factor-like helix-turn-helix DNA-binding protein n=1 Tax=Comamonas sp. TaxID=34028 RepID=UPI0028A00EC5|nr:sigma factor-like helix-turn-helix DNA-binding protein [Comamonas sp.]